MPHVDSQPEQQKMSNPKWSLQRCLNKVILVSRPWRQWKIMVHKMLPTNVFEFLDVAKSNQSVLKTLSRAHMKLQMCSRLLWNACKRPPGTSKCVQDRFQMHQAANQFHTRLLDTRLQEQNDIQIWSFEGSDVFYVSHACKSSSPTKCPKWAKDAFRFVTKSDDCMIPFQKWKQTRL